MGARLGEVGELVAAEGESVGVKNTGSTQALLPTQSHSMNSLIERLPVMFNKGLDFIEYSKMHENSSPLHKIVTDSQEKEFVR